MKKNIITLLLCFASITMIAQTNKPARTIVTTDGEVDDIDSFIRMLLYTNEFKTEGLVISSSQWHYAGDGKGTKFISEMPYTKKIYGERTELRWPGTQWIYNLVDAYGQVYPNLKNHDSRYPIPEDLKSKIAIGNIAFEGEMEIDTDGSNLIKKVLLDDNPDPVYLQAWGGTNTIARALKSIEDQYKPTPEWQSIYEKVGKKTIIYTILDQDATYKKYVEPNWPNRAVFYNANQFWCFAYDWKKKVPQPYHKYMNGAFMSKNILHNKGPLLKMYHSYGDGNQPLGEFDDRFSNPAKLLTVEKGPFTKYSFISEGDTPAFLHLVDMGLGNFENPNYGGWSGRLNKSEKIKNRFEDGESSADFNPFTKQMDLSYAQTRWVPDIQNDFAARASWCVLSYKNANHAPKFRDPSVVVMEVNPGSQISLQPEAVDPDGNKLTYSAWLYKEISDSAIIKFKVGIKGDISVKMQKNCIKGETYHIIVEANDNGIPNLKAYKRIIIKIK
ncbi:MAG: nucleoside hydrolase-like domain-containing protein [Leadbetterella sp.]